MSSACATRSGAALFCLSLALRRLGSSPATALFPDAEQADLLATVHIGGDHEPMADERAMFEAIPQRHTNRHAFEPTPVPDSVIAELARGAAAEDAWLEAISDEPGKHALAALIGDANRLQLADDSRAWLGSGQALARILLTATAAGLSASFLNQPIQLPSHRPLVAEAIGRSGYPQQLLRLGYGPPVTPTPRRPLEDVLL